MKTIKKLYYFFIILAIAVLGIAFVTVLVNISILSSNKMELNEPYKFDDYVEVIMEDGRQYQSKIPLVIETTQSFKIVLNMENIGIIDDKTLSFISKDTIINCEVDDNVIYRNIANMHESYYNDANTIYLIDLPKKVNDNIITLYYENTKDFLTTFELKDIKVGKRADIISYYFLVENFFELLLFVFLLIFAVTVLGVSLKLKRREVVEKYFIYMGLLALVVAFYIISLLPISYFIYQKYGIILNLIKYASIMLIPILALKTTMLIVEQKFKKYMDLLIVIASINIIVQQLCLYFKKFSFSEMLVYSIIILIVSIVVIVISFVSAKSVIEEKLNKFILIMLSLLLGILYQMVDLLLNGIMTTSLFFEITVFISFSAQFIQFFNIYISYREDKIRADIYKKLAYTDKFTDVGNRAAFDENRAVYQQIDSNFFVIIMDIDNLKYINDNYGHKYGDSIIKMLAEKLKSGFDSRYKKDIYRIGGDEFCIIYYAPNDIDIDGMLEQITEEYDLSSIDNGVSNYSLSYGYKYYDGANGASFDRVLHLADQAMYHKKSKKKNNRIRKVIDL